MSLGKTSSYTTAQTQNWKKLCNWKLPELWAAEPCCSRSCQTQRQHLHADLCLWNTSPSSCRARELRRSQASVGPCPYAAACPWNGLAVMNSSHFSKALSTLGEVGHRKSAAPLLQALAALLQHTEIWRADHSCRHPTTVSVWYSCMHANQLLQFFQECLIYRQSNLTHYIVCLLTLCCYNWNKDIQMKILRKMRSQEIMRKIFN